jgi:spore germination protein YaaH
MAGAGHRGAVLDFEALAPGDLPALLAVVTTIADTLHAWRLGPVVVAIPAADTVAYPGRALIEAGADFILPMLYDQHWAGGHPGPVAEPRWVEATLGPRIREVGPARIVAGLPLYGYRWASPGKGVTVTLPEIQDGLLGNVSLIRDSLTGSLRGTLPDGGEVWVTDAALLRTLMSVAEGHGVHRFALWYVGQEDPAIWRDLHPRRENPTPDR